MNRRIAAALLAIPLALAALTGCGSSPLIDDSPSRTTDDSAWPQKVVDNFVSSCEVSSGGQAAYCECSVEKLQDRYTIDEYIELEKKFESDPDAIEELSDVIVECQAEVK